MSDNAYDVLGAQLREVTAERDRLQAEVDKATVALGKHVIALAKSNTERAKLQAEVELLKAALKDIGHRPSFDPLSYPLDTIRSRIYEMRTIARSALWARAEPEP